MSHKKEILDLLSQATTHKNRAIELEERAKILKYEDVLEEWGIKHNEVVQLKECKARICGLHSHVTSCCTWVDSIKLKKDGTDSAFHKTIYGKDEIIR